MLCDYIVAHIALKYNSYTTYSRLMLQPRSHDYYVTAVGNDFMCCCYNMPLNTDDMLLRTQKIARDTNHREIDRFGQTQAI